MKRILWWRHSNSCSCCFYIAWLQSDVAQIIRTDKKELQMYFFGRWTTSININSTTTSAYSDVVPKKVTLNCLLANDISVKYLLKWILQSLTFYLLKYIHWYCSKCLHWTGSRIFPARESMAIHCNIIIQRCEIIRNFA